jgi:hypothetical protein
VASKLKQKATEAMTNLKKYLRRDKPGLAMLEPIAKYTVELRQTQAKLKAEITSLTAKLDASRQQVVAADAKRTMAEEQVVASAAAHRQLTVDVSNRDGTIRQLYKETELPEPGPMPSDCGFASPAYMALLKSVQKSMKRAPEWLNATACPKHILMFDPNVLLGRRQHSDYVLLGKFVLVATMANFPVGFCAGTHDLRKGADEKVLKRFAGWMDTWLPPKEKCLEDRVNRTKLAMADPGGLFDQGPA